MSPYPMPYDDEGYSPEQDEAERGGPGGMRRPYGPEQNLGRPAQMGAGATPASQAESNLAQLPPDMQEAVLMVLGSDPMISSALLQVLGAGFEPLISKAMKMHGQQMMQDGAGMGSAGIGPAQPPMA